MSVVGTIYERDILKGHGKLLLAQTASNVASVAFTSAVLTTEFDNYLFDLTDVTCTVVSFLNIHGSTDNGASWLPTSAYYASLWNRSNQEGNVTSGAAVAFINISGNQGAAGYPMGGEVFFTRLSSINSKHFVWHTSCYEGPQHIQYRGGGYFGAADINTIKFQYNAGNIGYGNFRLYGLRRGVIT